MNRRKIDFRILGLMLVATIMGSALTLGVYKSMNSDEAVYRIEHTSSIPGISSNYVDGTASAPTSFTEAAEKVMPAVVHIKSTVMRNSRTLGPGMDQIPEQFKDFFGEGFGTPGQRGPQPSIGSGSGVIISEDGYIITNNHVIDKAEDIEVSLYDNRTFKAEIIGTDPTTDLALLRIEESGLPHLIMANSDDVKVGEWVLAVGNPFNLNSTVTAGIVSAKARNIRILQDRSAIESFIQTDAAVNPGNSGGALVNINGDLIGINTAIASRTGSYAGYSFAVPVSIARKVVEDLIQYGSIQRGYLGVIIRSVDGNLAKEKDLSLNTGVYVDSVMANSSAADGGIEIGDVITGVNGKSVRNVSELQESIGTKRPGDKVEVAVNRNGSEKTLNMVLKSQSGSTALVAERQASTEDAATRLGGEFETIDKDLSRKLDIDGGVRVNSVGNGKLYRETDMREGFIITHVDGKKITSVKELNQILENKEGGVMLEGKYEDYPGSYYYAFGM